MQNIGVTHIPVEFIRVYRSQLLLQLDQLRVQSGSQEDMNAAALEITYQRGKRDALELLLADYEKYVTSNTQDTPEPSAGPSTLNEGDIMPKHGMAAAEAIGEQLAGSDDLFDQLTAASSEVVPLHPDLKG